MTEINKSSKLYTVLATALVVLLLVLTGLWLYSGSLTPAKRSLFLSFHLPVASVSGSFINLNDLAARTALSANVSPEQATAQALSASIKEKQVAVISANKGLKLPSTEVDQAYDYLVQTTAGGDQAKFSQSLSQGFAMTPEQFKSQVLLPQERLNALHIWFNSQSNLNAAAAERFTQVKGDLNRGVEFSEVAKTYSDDESSKVFAGDSGVANFQGLLPEIKQALAKAKTGDIVYLTTRYGLQAVKVLERDGDQIHLQTILIAGGDFDSWLNKEVQKYPAHLFLAIK